MPRNIDKATAPLITLVPETRNFEVVQGDNRALMGIRFRDAAASTMDAPVYDPIHASEWAGHVLRSRGGTQNAPLQFNNVTFPYTSGGMEMMSNNEVQVHIPWEDPMLATGVVNPPPNRPINLLYDIWQVTYPGSTDSFVTSSPTTVNIGTTPTIFAAGDRVHFSDVAPVNTSTASNASRTSDSIIEVTVTNPERFSVGNYAVLQWQLSGQTEVNYLIGLIQFIDVSNDTVRLRLVTLTNGGTDGDSTVPATLNGSLDTTQSLLVGLTPVTATELSQNRFRGTIGIRERIYNNSHAGNDDTPTNGG